MSDVKNFVDQVIENVEKVIIGKAEVLELVMVALLCEGHVLLEDVPGTGKTMMARSIAVSMGGNFKRVQCTPDLLPNDITGVSIFNQRNSEFEFRPGPVFGNILLADEINRATPRTQSALLEAMQEQQVTVDGETRKLPRPFLVMATQNPIEYEGTFPLPEAQLDRFLMRISVGYPDSDEEILLLNRLRREHPVLSLEPVVDGARIMALQPGIWDIHIDESLQQYIVELCSATRSHQDIALGVSPRASLALFKASQALAAVRGRDHVLPDDIQYLIAPIFTHRLIVKPEAQLRGHTASSILANIVEKTRLDLGELDSEDEE